MQRRALEYAGSFGSPDADQREFQRKNRADTQAFSAASKIGQILQREMSSSIEVAAYRYDPSTDILVLDLRVPAGTDMFELSSVVESRTRLRVSHCFLGDASEGNVALNCMGCRDHWDELVRSEISVPDGMGALDCCLGVVKYALFLTFLLCAGYLFFAPSVDRELPSIPASSFHPPAAHSYAAAPQSSGSAGFQRGAGQCDPLDGDSRSANNPQNVDERYADLVSP